MKHSKFKAEPCKECKGIGFYPLGYMGFIVGKEPCPDCKGGVIRTGTDTIDLDVPEGYEYSKLSGQFIWFVRSDTKGWEREIYTGSELPHKLHDTETFICEVCTDGKGTKWEIEDGLMCIDDCPQCKGSPKIEAEVTKITVNDNQLVEKWSEV